MKKLAFTFALAILAIALKSCAPSNEICKIPTEPPLSHMISKKQAKMLQENFFKNQKLAQSGNMQAIASQRSDFWFPSKELTDYLLYTQKKAEANGYKITGFRMYLGADPGSVNGASGKYKIFIVPTVSKVGGKSGTQSSMMKISTSASSPDQTAMDESDDLNFDPFDISGSGNPPRVYTGN